jgi:regulatory protein
MERKITALQAQKRNPQRVSVYLDGEFAFGLARITAAWLSVGQLIDEVKIRELQAADEEEVAYQKALHFLSYRPRSENEVRGNLRKHNFSDEVILDVIDRLRRSHLVNDLEFARSWVENRSDFRPRGRQALKLELRQKGIADEVIEDVLDNLDEDALAYQAALKQSGKYNQLEWLDFRQKMGAFLARRGFHYGIAGPILKKVWAEMQSSHETEK